MDAPHPMSYSLDAFLIRRLLFQHHKRVEHRDSMTQKKLLLMK